MVTAITSVEGAPAPSALSADRAPVRRYDTDSPTRIVRPSFVAMYASSTGIGFRRVMAVSNAASVALPESVGAKTSLNRLPTISSSR